MTPRLTPDDLIGALLGIGLLVFITYGLWRSFNQPPGGSWGN